MNPSFWEGRRVFVTGHTGFKGSWLALWLQSLSAEVTGFALSPPTDPSLFEIANVAAGMQAIEGDIRDLPHLFDAMASCRPEIVFHMAAQSVVRNSYADPIETYSTNVMGTVNLLEALRRLSGRTALVNVTSDKCYENLEWVWGYRENDRLGGADPYSSSKACAELATESFIRSFFKVTEKKSGETIVATARAGNVIGGGDWTPHQLVPEIVAAFRDKRSPVLRNPRAVRPWQHVLDCLHGYLVLAEKLLEAGQSYSGSWNFGPSSTLGVSVGSVVEKMITKWPGAKSWTWDRDPDSHPHEAGLLRLDSSKANCELGWMPLLSLEQALDWVSEWYFSYYQGQSPVDLCQEQIARFGEADKARATER